MKKTLRERGRERQRETESQRQRQRETERQRERTERERDLKSMAADRNSIIISYINAITWKIPSYRCFE